MIWESHFVITLNIPDMCCASCEPKAPVTACPKRSQHNIVLHVTRLWFLPRLGPWEGKAKEKHPIYLGWLEHGASNTRAWFQSLWAIHLRARLDDLCEPPSAQNILYLWPFCAGLWLIQEKRGSDHMPLGSNTLRAMMYLSRLPWLHLGIVRRKVTNFLHSKICRHHFLFPWD